MNNNVWSRENVTEAIMRNNSRSAALRHLGFSTWNSTNDRKLKYYIELYSLNIDHMLWQRNDIIKSISRDDLATLVSKSRSYAEVARRLGIDPAHSGSRMNKLASLIRKHEISTEHMTGQAWNRGNVISPEQYESEAKKLIERLPKLWRLYSGVRKKIFLFGILPEQCAKCNIKPDDFKSGKIQIDHINGDSFDNRLENLRPMCPNCHSQTETFCRQGNLIGPMYCVLCGIYISNGRKDTRTCAECYHASSDELKTIIRQEPDKILASQTLGICRICSCDVPLNAFLCFGCNGDEYRRRKLIRPVSQIKYMARAAPNNVQKNLKFCCDCKKEISRKAVRCKSCASIYRETTRIDWPDIDTLLHMIEQLGGFNATGRELGVSDNAIRKHLKVRGAL